MHYNIDINEQRSTLIKKVEWEDGLLIVHFRKYYVDKLIYENVEFSYFKEFSNVNSVGKYYLHFIKPNFLQLKNATMAERKTKNTASDKTRFLKISIDVTKINKDFIHVGEKGNYLNITLHMKPDGEVDQFGNLGFITQDVPRAVYEKDKTIKGSILGNAAEMDYGPSAGEIQPGDETGKLNDGSINDDLPF